MQKILENRMFVSVLLSVILTFAFVFAVAYSATTISTDITTAGTLTISTSLNGPLQVNAGVVSATTTIGAVYGGTGLTAGGLKASFIPFGAGISAFATSTYLSFTSPILTATFASTTAVTIATFASTTDMVVSGTLGVGSTSTPAGEISAVSTATTTLYLHSNSTTKGGCIEMEGANGTAYRLVAGAPESATTTGGVASFTAFWVAGGCK